MIGLSGTSFEKSWHVSTSMILGLVGSWNVSSPSLTLS